MSSTMSEHSPIIKIDRSKDVQIGGMTFSANGEHLLVDGWDGVHVWRVKDGKLEAKLEAEYVHRLAVSRDGRLVAAGTKKEIILWDAVTYKKTFSYAGNMDNICGLHFSPDSTRLVIGSKNGMASIWDTATCERVRALRHEIQGCNLVAAKFSPQGDRIATAASCYLQSIGVQKSNEDSVRVWDNNDGRLLIDIPVRVNPVYNTGLLWFNDHLFVLSDGKIKEFEASTGLMVSEWSVPASDCEYFSCIVLPQNGEFIAHSLHSTITFWDISTHAQLGIINHPQGTLSIALSPDDRFLAICEPHDTTRAGFFEFKDDRERNKTIIKRLSRVAEPDIQIDDAVLDFWKDDQIGNAEALLTATSLKSGDPSHHLVLASRAVVRTRLRKWDEAIADAEKSIKIRPSVIGYIAKGIAHVGKGERHKGYRACDIALEHFHPSHVSFLLLAKAIIVFLAGEHDDAMSRVDDLITTLDFNTICYVVQSYMYLLLGNSQMERRDYVGAIQSFQRARTQMRHHTSRPLSAISLIFGWKFDDLDITIQQRLCEAVYRTGRMEDIVKYLLLMITSFDEEVYMREPIIEWISDFTRRCHQMIRGDILLGWFRTSSILAKLGDTAVGTQRHDTAISLYSAALFLNPLFPQCALIKRSKARMAIGLWKEALEDADQVITLDPSSPWGYEMKHAALHKAGDYDNAIDAFEMMLLKIVESPDLDIPLDLRKQYVSPSSTRTTIRKTVQRTVRRLPRMLINTTTGYLHDRDELVSIFESLPIFKELVSSMTTRIDRARIKREVRQYFQYVMLSHKWEPDEPLFQQVVQVAVYDLDQSPTHGKLQTFCKIARDAGYNWAWSDTCCINKQDHLVLQEALVAMFKWYRGSAMMIVFLRGVRSLARFGELVTSIWNSRGWTLQEYIAAKVIRFYAEDWTLYLDLDLPNHKDSPAVISEMEQATGVSAQQLMALCPGLTCIREKLQLASTRNTTRVEDAAYSLLGIFSVTGIHAIYGEGDGALGRLLAHVLAGSGDVSILAWTGESGSFNSCLPAHITVFKEAAMSHLPLPIEDAEMGKRLQTPSFDLDTALKLYDQLRELHAPWFAACRMKLPCIAFPLPPLTSHRTRSGRVYRADTPTFGIVEIRTRQNLSRMKSLYLIHPWLDTLLDREVMQSSTLTEDDVTPPSSPHTDGGGLSEEEVEDDSLSVSEPGLPPLSTPVPTTTQMDKETQARRLVARLKQPFGALLFALVASGRREVDYQRVAADSLITVRFQEDVSLVDILDNVRTLDVL